MKSFEFKSGVIYDQYYDIDPQSYHERIRYFDSHIQEIYQLAFPQSLHIRIDNCIALYKVGAHRQFLRKADRLINLIISENIYHYQDRDIYYELLTMKAEAHHRVREYRLSTHVLRELIKIRPQDKQSKKHFIKAMCDYWRHEAQFVRGLSIILFLSAGIVIAMELLIVRSFYMQYTQYVELTRNLMLLSGILLLFGNEIRFRINAQREFRNLINQC